MLVFLTFFFTGALRKQLKQTQLLAEDNEWQLQEQLAHMNSILQGERDVISELKSKLIRAEGSLVEVEMFLGSDRGAIALQLEEELAASRLRIAELEAEKDELDLNLNKMKKSYIANIKENIHNNIR